MSLLGLLLLIASTWYLLYLYQKFNNDQVAKEEINIVWEEAKKEAKSKNPFLPGRIKDALNSYKSEITKEESNQENKER